MHVHKVQPLLSTGLPYAHFMGGHEGHLLSLAAPVSCLAAASTGGGMLS